MLDVLVFKLDSHLEKIRYYKNVNFSWTVLYNVLYNVKTLLAGVVGIVGHIRNFFACF